MAFTMPQYPILTPEQASPFHMALRTAMDNYKQNIENAYLPMTKGADIASKLAYANLMGPQFMAKLMGNRDILANMSEGDRQNALKTVYQAGTGQASGNGFVSRLGFPGLSGPGMPGLSGINTENASPADQQAIANQQPLQPYVVQGNSNQAAPQPVRQAAPSNGMPPSDQPEADEGMLTYDVQPTNKKSFAENTADYNSVVAEGEESGKIRAKDIEDLNDTAYVSKSNQGTLNYISKILNTQTFKSMRDVPLAGHYELDYYGKFGTPEQQEMVGEYYASQGQLVADASQNFKGQFRQGEQTLLEGMKPSKSDTAESAMGKTEALSMMNTFVGQRARIVAKLMEQKHLSKGAAMDQADKMIDADKIRESVRSLIYPKVTIQNKTTGEKKTVSRDEARKMGVPNV